MTARRRRWDDDARGVGVADARAWRPLVATLAAVTETDGWVAEEPEAHLLPHLAAATTTGPLRIRRSASEADGTFLVELDWIGPHEATRRAVRAALFGLVATVAETVTVLRERPEAGGRELEALTGAEDGEDPFAGHGHTIRFTVAVADRDTTPPAE